jgi:hypothetical protein
MLYFSASRPADIPFIIIPELMKVEQISCGSIILAAVAAAFSGFCSVVG